MSYVIVNDTICDPALYAGLQVVSVTGDAAAIAARSATAPALDVAAERLAYVTYTSGSTGRPKGVAVMQRGVVRLVSETDYVTIAPDDRFLQFAPLAFDASTFEIWAPLLNGASLAIPRDGLLSIEDLGGTIERHGVTTMFLTTSLFQRMVDSRARSFRGLRHVLTGGEVASPAHMRRFLETYPACRLTAVYGPTENTTFSTWCDLPTPGSIGENVPIGRPIAHSTAHVVDEQLRVVADGVAGELCVGGDGVARGYVHLAVLSSERFVVDPFRHAPGARLYRTGDRARVRADGLLEFLGRTDDQVKVGGHRIELGEIEAALQAFPTCSDAAVGLTEIAGDKALAAFVVTAAGHVFDERIIREFLAERLPRFMMPSRIVPIEALPEHASGKLDRVALARLAAALGAGEVRAPAPNGAPRGTGRAATQKAVAACWSEVLGRADVADIDQNFFDAGGDSLRLLTLHARLQREFGVQFGIVDLFEQCTIRKLGIFVNALVA